MGKTNMERLKASDFPQEVLKLFDGYVHGMLDRREFRGRIHRQPGGTPPSRGRLPAPGSGPEEARKGA